MTDFTEKELPNKYNVIFHTPSYRNEPCLEVVQRRDYFASGILFKTLGEQEVEALKHLGVEFSTHTPIFYSPAKIATLIESLPLLESMADDIRRAGRVPNKRHG